MPAPYLSPTDAAARLTRYRITGSPNETELSLASDEIDARSGWIGNTYASGQLRAFPRSVTVQDDVAGTVPSRVLDWVALRAFQLSEDDDPDVTQEKVDVLSFSYGGRGKRSRTRRLMQGLLKPYRFNGTARIVS